VVAAFQALLEESGVEKYYRDEVTPLIRLAMFMGAFHTGLHSVLLLRIRTFLSVSQLRSICLYKVVFNIILPIFWMPELSPNIRMNTRIAFSLWICVTLSYLFGFLWAGKAEGVSRILSSEKES
jgi:hypothetical protein